MNKEALLLEIMQSVSGILCRFLDIEAPSDEELQQYLSDSKPEPET